MVNFRIYPYKLASQSARRLKQALGGRPLLKPDGNYRYREGDKIINWGNSTEPRFLNDAGDNIINKPHAVGIASNKLHAFNRLTEHNVPTVPFTTDPEEASEWDGDIYARYRLQGHSGEGIVIVGQDDLVPTDAPLYTKKIEDGIEYRVHVMNGTVFDYRKKCRVHEDEPTDEQKRVKTLGNGWIYRQGDLRRIDRVEDLAVRAIEAMGLDFGAVDIIMSGGAGEVYVLEVNTAVGLADNTLEAYINAFNQNYASIR